MRRSKVLLIWLAVSMIALTISLGLSDSYTPKESLAKAVNEHSIQEMEWNQTYGGKY